MISSELRNRKARLISNIGYESACAYQNSCFEAAHVLDRQLSAFRLAYQEVDSDLFWFSIYVSRMVGEFIVSDARNFTAFAMFKACQAFQGLQLDESDEQPEEQPVHHLTPEAAAENIEIAEQWREESLYYPGERQLTGYVIVYAGQVAGWINKLRDPQSWQPGSIAVDPDGNQYQSFGGDEYYGARSWGCVWNIKNRIGAAA